VGQYRVDTKSGNLVRLWWKRTMCERHDPLIHRLVARLGEPDALVRRNALGSLRLHGEHAAEATRAVARLLTDLDPAVRCEAERTLESIQRRHEAA
jgi:HEAT repeat protein